MSAFFKSILLSALLLPIISLAQNTVSGQIGSIGTLSYSIQSQLVNIASFSDLLLAILTVFITVATPIVVLFIIIAGFKYVTAQGNAQQVQEATRAITYALIGGVLIIGAVAIAAIITNVVNSLTA